LEIEYNKGLKITNPYFDKIADNVSEEWVQRYRKERQTGWNNKGW
jgi:LPS sulfotransferase NodH